MKTVLGPAVAILCSCLLLQGCGFLAGAAVGGTAGYMMKDEGYDVRNPVTKDEQEGYNLRSPVTHEADR
jgi:hypothetical protein